MNPQLGGVLESMLFSLLCLCLCFCLCLWGGGPGQDHPEMSLISLQMCLGHQAMDDTMCGALQLERGATEGKHGPAEFSAPDVIASTRIHSASPQGSSWTSLWASLQGYQEQIVVPTSRNHILVAAN